MGWFKDWLYRIEEIFKVGDIKNYIDWFIVLIRFVY